jgi:hypothetical protein
MKDMKGPANQSAQHKSDSLTLPALINALACFYSEFIDVDAPICFSVMFRIGPPTKELILDDFGGEKRPWGKCRPDAWSRTINRFAEPGWPQCLPVIWVWGLSVKPEILRKR